MAVHLETPPAGPARRTQKTHWMIVTGALALGAIAAGAAQMGVAIVVSRSGITQMGHQVAQSVGLCAIGRATNKRFVCYASPQRLQLEPGLVVRPELVAPQQG